MSKRHPLPKLYIEYEVSSNGKVLKKGRIKSQTWVGNIVAMLSSMFYGGTSVTNCGMVTGRADIIDVGGSSRGLLVGVYSNTAGLYAGVRAPSRVDTYGILVGTSDAPVSLSQYALASKIAHGTGAGQLSYGDTSVDPLVKDTTWTVRVIRTFSNSSGATITVKEMGLFMTLYQYQFMLARDVISAGIAVPNGSTLTLRYIIQHSLS